MIRNAVMGGLAAAACLATTPAQAFPTTLCIRNQTAAAVTTRISEIDHYDWDDDVRPDHNFDRVEIAPGAMFCAPEHTNGFARPSFSLQLLPNQTLYRIIAGSPIEARVRPAHQGPRRSPSNRPFAWALHRHHGGTLHGDPSIRASDPMLEIGYRCMDGVQCWMFRLEAQATKPR